MSNMKRVVLVVYALVALFLVSCSDDDNGVRLSAVRVTVDFPEKYQSLLADSVTVVFENTADKRIYTAKTDVTGVVELTVEEGVYNISASVEKLSAEEHGATLSFQVAESGVGVSGLTVTRTLHLELAALNKEWLIREIYYSGTKTVGDKSYYNDQYVVIYNNSNRTLYADGLSFCESYQTTAYKTNFMKWSTFLPGRIAAEAIYTIPGNGTEHPVKPGEGVVLTRLAVNHTLPEFQSRSTVDMSKADFEWSDGVNDADVAEVPNLIKNFCYTKTTWLLNIQGTKSYFIFKLDEGMDMKSFMDANYIEGTNSGSGKTTPAYAVPVRYIYDGVEVSQKDVLKEKALPSSVDAGYTYCTASSSGKVVSRKVASWDGERAILQDTNNSANDFNTDQEPMY